MRYADRPATHSEILIRAAPERVWELVTNIELPAETSAELQAVEWLDGARGPAVGARFLGLNESTRMGPWRTLSQIVELDAPLGFGWVVMVESKQPGVPLQGPDEPIASWRFNLVPEAEGVRLRQSVQLGPGKSGVTWMIRQAPEHEEQIIQQRLDELAAAIDTTLNDIRARAEAGGS